MSDKPWEGGSFSHWPTIRRVDRPGMTATEVLMREQERKFYSSPPTHYGFDVNAAQEIYEQYRQSLGLPIVEPRAISGALLCNVLPDSVPETPKAIGEFLGEHGCTLKCLGPLDLLRREVVSFGELGAEALAGRFKSALHSNNDSWRYCVAFLVPYAEPFLRNAVADGASFYDPSQRGGLRDRHALAYINRLAHLASKVRVEYLETHGDDADTEEDNTMNLRNAVYLIRDDIVTVIARAQEGNNLTYLCEQGLAKQLSAALGDKKRPVVAVRCGNSRVGGVNLLLAEVLEVHAEPVIDVNYKGVYRYVVGMVDATDVLEREKEDDKMHTMLKRKQQSSARDQVLAGLGIGDRKEFLEHVRSTVDAVESDDVGGGDAAD